MLNNVKIIKFVNYLIDKADRSIRRELIIQYDSIELFGNETGDRLMTAI